MSSVCVLYVSAAMREEIVRISEFDSGTVSSVAGQPLSAPLENGRRPERAHHHCRLQPQGERATTTFTVEKFNLQSGLRASPFHLASDGSQVRENRHVLARSFCFIVKSIILVFVKS